MNFHIPILLLLVSGLLPRAISQHELPSPDRSAPAVPQDAEPGKKAPFVFEVGTVPLEALIARCGAYLQCNILVDSQELAVAGGARPKARPAAAAEPKSEDEGPFVSLQLPVVTDRDGCEELLSSMLWANGLSLVALDADKSVYEVLAMEGRRAREIAACAVRRTAEQVLARPMLRSVVTTVYTLKHTNAQIANNALRPFFASSSSSQNAAASLLIGNVGNKSSLILTGPQFMVASALQLLQEADVPDTELPELLEGRLRELSKTCTALLERLEALEQRLAGK